MITSRIRHGFSLVEVTLALSVIAISLLALFGLLPVGLNSNQNSVEQSSAANIAASIISDLQATSKANTKSSRFDLNIASTGSPQVLFFGEDTFPTGTGRAGGTTVNDVPPARYRAAVEFKTFAQKNATSVRIVVTWPAVADPSSSDWPTNFSGIFETVVALDRN